LFREALMTVGIVAAPFVLCALAVGLMTALVQAATQLQENVLSFVPKIAAIGVVLALLGPWALGQLSRYMRTAADTMVRIGSGADR